MDVRKGAKLIEKAAGKAVDLTDAQASKLTHADRQLIAQYNATIDLGLPPGNTAMERAAALEFRKGAYHGTGHGEVIDAFNPEMARGERKGTGTWFSENPDFASSYAPNRGGSVYPVMLRTSDFADFYGNGNNWSRLDPKTPIHLPDGTREIPANHLASVFDEVTNTNDVARLAKANNASGLTFENVQDSGPYRHGSGQSLDSKFYDDNHVVFDPANIRSRFAAFDPRRLKSKDLLAGGAGLAAIAAATAPGEAEARSLKPVDVSHKNFKTWFGDSKVVDDAGKPLRVYHGTNKEFDAFDPKLIGTGTDDGWLGHGFYTSSDPSVADAYGPKNMHLYMSIKNPYDMTGQNFHKVLQSHGGPKGFSQWLRDNGYDGAKMWSQYMALDPTQIKSAVSNTGDFSLTDPRITHGIAPLAGLAAGAYALGGNSAPAEAAVPKESDPYASLSAPESMMYALRTIPDSLGTLPETLHGIGKTIGQAPTIGHELMKFIYGKPVEAAAEAGKMIADPMNLVNNPYAIGASIAMSPSEMGNGSMYPPGYEKFDLPQELPAGHILPHHATQSVVDPALLDPNAFRQSLYPTDASAYGTSVPDVNLPERVTPDGVSFVDKAPEFDASKMTPEIAAIMERMGIKGYAEGGEITGAPKAFHDGLFYTGDSTPAPSGPFVDTTIGQPFHGGMFAQDGASAPQAFVDTTVGQPFHGGIFSGTAPAPTQQVDASPYWANPIAAVNTYYPSAAFDATSPAGYFLSNHQFQTGAKAPGGYSTWSPPAPPPPPDYGYGGGG